MGDHLTEAHRVLFQRYLDKLNRVIETLAPYALPAPHEKRTSNANLKWMCETALDNLETFPPDKLSRWLGFVQGVMAVHGYLSVDEERDFSRPLFHKAYGLKAPPTMSQD